MRAGVRLPENLLKKSSRITRNNHKSRNNTGMDGNETPPIRGHNFRVPGGTGMAKRFTDTTKWKRPWFRTLGIHAKVLWQYMCDECDHAGIFIADFELVSFQVGFKVDEEKLTAWLGDKLVRVDRDKYFIPSFFEFQYGGSDAMFRAKQGALKVLADHALIDPATGQIKDLTNSCLRPPKGSLTLIELQGIGTITGKELIPDFSAKQRVTQVELEEAYKEYPRKEGKSEGMRLARAEIKTKSDLANFRKAIGHYRDKCKSAGKAPEFIKYFSSFMAEWTDWLDPSHGTGEDFSNTSQARSTAPVERLRTSDV
jgi:hypothetical protein